MGAEAFGMAVLKKRLFPNSQPHVHGAPQISQGQAAGVAAGTVSHRFLRQACCSSSWLESLCPTTNSTQRVTLTDPMVASPG